MIKDFDNVDDVRTMGLYESEGIKPNLDWSFDFTKYYRIDILLLIPRLLLFGKAVIRYKGEK